MRAPVSYISVRLTEEVIVPNGYALRLMQSISYTKQYDLDTGEMSYREIRQSIVRLHWQSKTVVYTSITEVIVETVGTGRSCVP